MMECATLCACVCVRAYVCVFDTEINSRKISMFAKLFCFTLYLKTRNQTPFFSLSYNDVTGWSFLNNK